MNRKYIFLKIKPLSPFFFGSENTFNTRRKDKYNNYVTNYYAKGRSHPQQTALLGMIRHYLLVITESLYINKELKKPIIGEKSFDGVHHQDYGYLKSLSPIVIISDNNKVFLPAPKTFKSKTTSIDVDQEAQGYFQVLDKKRKMPSVSGYDAKSDFLNLQWINEQQEKASIDTFTKVGIKIKSEEEGYYRQDLKYLKEGDAFGCWITISEEAQSKLQKVIMPFGGDGGIFEVTPEKEIDFIFREQSPTKVLSLVSDAFIKKEDLEDAEYGITQYVDFRYIKSKKKDYYQLDPSDKSHHTRLMEKGSILFFPDPDTASNFADKLRTNIPFRKIGYNYFKFQ